MDRGIAMPGRCGPAVDGGAARRRGADRVWLRRTRDGGIVLRVLRGCLLSGNAGYGIVSITPAIPVFANRVVLWVFLQNAVGNHGLKVGLDGSYDRRAWREMPGGVAPEGVMQYATAGYGGVDFAYVRIRAWTQAFEGNVRFDAGLTFRAQ